MGTRVDLRTGLEELDEDTCLRFLAHSTLGRLAIAIAGRPMVFPVNFTLDGRAVILRTDEGTKLYGTRNGPVAFECDDFDAMYHTGWSVVVQGTAEEVRLEAEVERLQRLPLGPWSPGPKPVWLRIRPRTITGRRIPTHGTRGPEEAEGAPEMTLNVLVLENEPDDAADATRRGDETRGRLRDRRLRGRRSVGMERHRAWAAEEIVHPERSGRRILAAGSDRFR